MEDDNALTSFGINSCIAVVLAPIGDAIKNKGINKRPKTIYGLLISGIPQLNKIPIAAIRPTLIRPFDTFLFFNLSANHPPHKTPETDAATTTRPKYNPDCCLLHPNVRMKYVGIHKVQP